MKSFNNIFLKSTFVIFTLVLFSCKNEIKKVVEISELEKMPELVGEDIYFTQTEYGKLTIQVYTPKLLKYDKDDKPKTVFPKGIKVVHFDKYPDTLSMISANYAIHFENQDRWEAKGNVIAKNSKGEILNTEFLVWDQKKHTISSNQKVQVTTEGDIIEGNGFHSDEHFEKWEIEEVTGIFTIDENDN